MLLNFRFFPTSLLWRAPSNHQVEKEKIGGRGRGGVEVKILEGGKEMLEGREENHVRNGGRLKKRSFSKVSRHQGQIFRVRDTLIN